MRVVTDHPAAPDPTACLLTGTVGEGVGQIEDYAVIINPRLIQSIASVNWNTPSVWSCNSVPGASDVVIINNPHAVTVPLSLGNVNVAFIHVKPGAHLTAIAKKHASGGCE